MIAQTYHYLHVIYLETNNMKQGKFPSRSNIWIPGVISYHVIPQVKPIIL